jgi:hypothetical protein
MPATRKGKKAPGPRFFILIRIILRFLTPAGKHRHGYYTKKDKESTERGLYETGYTG